jgi:polyhydroxyalkanoate synthase
MDEWIDQWSTVEEPAPKPAKKAPARKSAARKSPTKRASAEAIGANPTRRYGSGSSRSLAR